MAESEARPPIDQAVLQDDEKLKYIDFVQVATIYVVVCLSTLYEYAKENSGPLRPGVEAVEGAVNTVLGPVCEKFHDLPFQLLTFVDRKVDESFIEMDHHVPALLKHVFLQLWTVARMAPKVAHELLSDVRRVGLVDTASDIAETTYIRCEPTLKELYAKYEPVVEQYAVTAWRTLNELPVFSQVAHIMVPTAAYWAERYNQAVACASERGYAAACYMPLVPTERISKTFGNESVVPPVSVNGQYAVVS